MAETEKTQSEQGTSFEQKFYIPADLMEEIIDTLIEVGNGTTDQQLHEIAQKLIEIRDEHPHMPYEYESMYPRSSKCPLDLI